MWKSIFLGGIVQPVTENAIIALNSMTTAVAKRMVLKNVKIEIAIFATLYFAD